MIPRPMASEARSKTSGIARPTPIPKKPLRKNSRRDLLLQWLQLMLAILYSGTGVGFGFRVQGSGFRVSGFGFGFRVHVFAHAQT